MSFRTSHRPIHLGHLLSASLLALSAGCAEQDPSAYDADEALEVELDLDAGIEEKNLPGSFKLRNAATGLCLRRSGSERVGNGYEVYQFGCDSDASGMWWRKQCSGGTCKYINGNSSTYCLKASRSVKTSGGSYNVYAARCSGDPDQTWSVQSLGGGGLQLKNADTDACAYATQGERTKASHLQIVQRACGTSSKFLFEPLSSGSVEPPPPARPAEPPQAGRITHIGTTRVYDSNGQGLRISRPSGSTIGDLLVLILHRTDDDLPLRVDGWTRAAECYKRDNGYQCSTEKDCTRWHNSKFCAYFGDRGREGHDLAQAIFYRTVGAGEPASYGFNLNVDSSGHPGWAFLSALRGAATSNPVRSWSHTGCDRSSASVFPSVYGRAGDMLLLSQSYDDAIAQSRFGAPSGTKTFGYVSQSDEAGFLFGRVLSATGNTGTLRTTGSGGSSCKDALVSLTIRPR